jgi:hypothetical protein
MGFSPVEVVFGTTPILPEAEPLFHCPTTSGYGQETGKFKPTLTGDSPSSCPDKAKTLRRRITDLCSDKMIAIHYTIRYYNLFLKHLLQKSGYIHNLREAST